MAIAITQLHVREKTDNNDGPDVAKYLNSIGLGEGYSWCQASVYWCFKQAAFELGVPNPVVKTGGVLKRRKMVDLTVAIYLLWLSMVASVTLASWSVSMVLTFILSRVIPTQEEAEKAMVSSEENV